jgi:hypothetical protein
MGWTKASTQDLKSLVGMMSSEQEKSVERSISIRISSVMAGEKDDIIEGISKGEIIGGGIAIPVGINEQSFAIFESK